LLIVVGVEKRNDEEVQYIGRTLLALPDVQMTELGGEEWISWNMYKYTVLDQESYGQHSRIRNFQPALESTSIQESPLDLRKFDI
jgi:hypothetical protein